MADESTPENLAAAFEQARLAGDHARMAELGPQLYPEPGEDDPTRGKDLAWSDQFRTKVAAKYAATQDVAKNTGALSPRAVIAAVNAELEKGHHTGRMRAVLLAQRDQAYQQDFEEGERAAAARAEPAPPPAAGYTAGQHPAPPPGRTWDAPVLDAVAAQLVTREIAPADVSRWLARGAALAQEEPGAAPALAPALIADARLALQAFLPERTMRAEVEKFLEETGLGNDEQFIRELAAKGAPLRRELEQAHAERRALGTMNPGAPGYADTAASINARFKRVYGGG